MLRHTVTMYKSGIIILRVVVLMLFKLRLFFCFLFVGVAYCSDGMTPTILYSKESPNSLIEVIQVPGSDLLDVCENKDYNTKHSSILPGNPTHLSQYETFATAGFCFSKNLKNILLLGVGGGEFLGYMNNYFLNTYVNAVDINPAMLEIIEKFRKIDTSRARFICEDAFKHIEKVRDSYDLIYFDVYPPKPLTAEKYKGFFENVKEHLNEGGVFVWNAYIPEITRAAVEDMFKNFKNVMAANTNDGANIVFICYQGHAKTKQDLEEAANDMQTQYNFRYALPDLLKETMLISPEENETWIMKFPVLS